MVKPQDVYFLCRYAPSLGPGQIKMIAKWILSLLSFFLPRDSLFDTKHVTSYYHEDIPDNLQSQAKASYTLHPVLSVWFFTPMQVKHVGKQKNVPIHILSKH